MNKIKIYNKFFAIALAGSISFVLVGAGINENDTKEDIDNTQTTQTGHTIGMFNILEIKEKSTTNPSIDEISEKIRLTLLKNEAVINVEGMNLSTSEAKQAYLNALIGNKEINPCEIWTPSYRVRKSNKEILEIIINYDCPLEEVETRRNAYEEKANNIVKLIPEEYSDINKARLLQDILVGNTKYECDYDKTTELLLNSAPAATLLDRKAVCSGYARTYADLLRRIGIPAQIIISNDGSHCWNIVYLDGNWYHIDVTYKACLDNLNLFCKSDEYVEKLYPEWTSSIICDDKSYDNGLLFEKTITKKNKTKLK